MICDSRIFVVVVFVLLYDCIFCDLLMLVHALVHARIERLDASTNICMCTYHLSVTCQLRDLINLSHPD